MPVVPTYGQPRVGTAPLPGARFSPEAPSAAFTPAPGPDLSGVTRVVAEIAQQEKQKADQVAVLDADNQLGSLQDTILYDPEKGVLNARGRNALDASQGVADQWQQGVSKIQAGLKNDTQREMFQRAALSRQADLHETVERHVAGELRAYDDDTTKAGIANAINDGIANYGDPARVDQSVAKAQAILKDYAKRNGLPPEVLQQQLADTTSKVHVGVLDRMLANGQDQAARTYYDAHKDAVTGDDAARVEQALEEGSARGESQRQADTITAKASTMTEALEQARSIDDPKVRDLTEQRIRQFYTEKRQADDDDRAQRFQQATNVVEQTHDVLKVPPSVWTTFTLPERTALRRYAEQLSSGTPPETNWQTYYDLKSLASADATRDKFLRTNLLTYRAQLGDTEFKELVGLQAGLRKGDGATRQQADGYQTTAQIVNGGLTAAGIDPTPKPGSDDAKRANLFRRAVDQQLAELEANTKKKPTAAQAQQVVDDLLVQGVVSGSGVLGHFQTTRRAFERQPGETLLFNVTDVPAADRAQIEDALRARGIPVTDRAVMDLYQRRLNQMAPVTEPPIFRGAGGGSEF